jgi:putative ABC transport system permease protein
MKTNFIYALRNIKKKYINTAITVFGLSVAIACCMIIYLYVIQEYNYDNFHKNADRIYRINYNLKYQMGLNKEVRLEAELIDILKKEVPQIEKCCEYRYAFTQLLSYNNNFFDVQMAYASHDFFEMFSFEFIAGNPLQIFNNPNELVLTQKLADKIFNKEKNYTKLLGKIIKYPVAFGNTPFTIVGIIKDIPKNSSINFDAVISGKSGRNFGGCNNYFGYTSIYYLTENNVNTKVVAENVNKSVTKYYQSRVKSMQDNNELVKTSDAFVPYILPLKETYLAGDIQNCFEKSTNKSNFTILITIALLILIIAISNYIILSLGQYLQRIGDVGIRKAMGANNKNIFTVFLSEAIIITLFSFLAGGLLCDVLIPVFAKLAQTEIYTNLIPVSKIAMFIGILFICVVVFTSIVPVLIFSTITPHQLASKRISVGRKNILSQMFVSVQYSLSIILIISTLFIVRQSNYLKNKSLGFDTNNIIDLHLNRIEKTDQKILLKKLLAQHPGVMNLSLVGRNFINGESDGFVRKDNGEQVDVVIFSGDHNYIKTLGLKLIEGKDFTETNENPKDRMAIVNSKFVEQLGIENPIGRTFNFWGLNFTIIGVVADYHFFNMESPIVPAMISSRTEFTDYGNDILLRYHPAQLSSVIKHIEKCYKQVAPDKELSYDFWNEKLKQRYETEDRWSKIIGWTSAIAIIISSLGLFGLSILLINQRIKEIGIRRVNGASSLEVLYSINKSFIGWLMGSLIISFPLAYMLTKKWLENFPYKIELSWWIFIIAGAIAFFVAIITVGWQSWSAARRNPVESLKYE